MKRWLSYLRDNNSVRIARSIKDIVYKALKAKEELINDLGREPTVKKLHRKRNIVLNENVIIHFD